MGNCNRKKAAPLSVVAVETGADVTRFDTLREGGHYLGARQPSGQTLRQTVVDEEGGWVAVAL